MEWYWGWRVAAVIVLLSSLLGLPVQVVAEKQVLYVQPNRANLRESPAIEADNIQDVLLRGTPVTAFESEGEWYPVQLQDGRTGWMHTSVLDVQQPSASPAARSSRLPVVRIGIVHDGGSTRADAIVSVFEKEIRDLLSGEFTVRFPAKMRLQADWTGAGVQTALDRLLANRQTDIIVALGVLASNDAGHRRNLPKPVFAPFVIDAQLQGIPQKDGASDIRNLSYITFPSNLRRDLQAFLDIVPLKTFALLASQGVVEALPELRNAVLRATEGLGLQVKIVPVGTTVDTALAALGDDIQAVYVAPLQQLAPGELKKLVDGLIARRLPSFSLWGRSEVEQGLLFSLARDTNMPRLARRVALNIQRALFREDPGTFPVAFVRGERMTFNMATARAIGLSPPWEFLTQMDVLHAEPADLPRRLALASVVQEAVDANLDIRAVSRFVAAGKENIREARSVLLPQIDVASDGRIIDADRAEAGSGSLPERQLTGSISLFQLIYDEPSWANLHVQRDLQSGREAERNITLLDVVLEAAVNYLNVLSAKTVERIQRNNLDLTRTNLELARVRLSIGVARPNEVLRWENQVANDRREVINAFSQRQQAEIVLNRVVHRPLEEKFTTAEPALDDPALMTNFARILPYVDNPRYFDIFRNFMVREGVEAAPELQQADAQITAQERLLLSEQRSFWNPTVSLRGDLTGVERGGKGSLAASIQLESERSITLRQDNAWKWEVGVRASLPLFTGGGRVARRNRAREELAQLRVEREAAAERIATNIRTALYKAGASYANIELAQAAAAAAQKNLELVSDAYGRGAVSILDLLDAQREALNANLDAANSVYVYLIDLMDMQRAVGQFDFFVTASGRKSWFERLDAFFRENGVTIEKGEQG